MKMLITGESLDSELYLVDPNTREELNDSLLVTPLILLVEDGEAKPKRVIPLLRLTILS